VRKGWFPKVPVDFGNVRDGRGGAKKPGLGGVRKEGNGGVEKEFQKNRGPFQDGGGRKKGEVPVCKRGEVERKRGSGEGEGSWGGAL